MLDKIAAIILVIVGIINILPVMVFFSPKQTQRLYGIPIDGESLTILTRHRGILLGLIGLALIYSVFRTDVRIAVITAAFISKIAFIFLVAMSENYSAELKQVALVDIGAIVLLSVVLAIHFYGK